jgi:hypothetical protein
MHVFPKMGFPPFFSTFGDDNKKPIRMSQIFKKPFLVFLILFLGLTGLFCFLPINIFDGEIMYQQGITKWVEPRPLSLYFLLGLEEYQTNLNLEYPGAIVVSKYLTAKGYAIAVIFMLGIPSLVGYRIHLQNTSH